MVETLKQGTNMMLTDVPEEFIFRCQNGHTMRNMRELAGELKTMSEETYSFHANTQKNDFATWVRDIIKDEWLAMNLQKAKNRGQAARMVADRIITLSKRK
jgi:hypothetical protein